MRHTKFLLTILALLLGGAVQAQTLSLTDIDTRIAEAHPLLSAYDAGIRASDEAALGARSWMPPEISTGLWMVPYNLSMISSRKDESGGVINGMGSYVIGVQQMIPNRSQLNANARYMQARSRSAKERKNDALNNLKSEARKEYYQWLVNKKKAVILTQNEILLTFIIKNAELRYKNGLDKIGAYYKAQAALGKTKSMQLEVNAGMDQARIMLNKLMNKREATPFDIDTLYTEMAFPVGFLDTNRLAGRSDVAAMDRDIALTYSEQALERTKLKPEFGVQYTHMIGFGQQPAQFMLMGMVKLPFLWAGKNTRANVESLSWKAEELRRQRESLLNDYNGMAQSLQVTYRQKQQQLKLYETQIIPALRKNFQVTQLGYEQNTEELFNLYDAWEALNMTQLEYLDQLQQLLLLQTELGRIGQTL